MSRIDPELGQKKSRVAQLLAKIQQLDRALQNPSNRSDEERDKIDQLVKLQTEVAEVGDLVNEKGAAKLLTLNKLADHKDLLQELGTLKVGYTSVDNRGNLEADWSLEVSRSQQVLADQRARYQATLELVKEVASDITQNKSKMLELGRDMDAHYTQRILAAERELESLSRGLSNYR